MPEAYTFPLASVKLSENIALVESESIVRAYENGSKWFGTKAFYVTDENVEHIEFVMDGQTYELVPDKNGFCVMSYDPSPEPVPDRFTVREGKATDGNGKVLYTVQSVTETYGNSEFEHYDWVKAE